ncbi:MAG: DUF3891 family protein [Planctomycetota bacterium]
MLKAHLDHETWLIPQHHHAQVSGYLAAHWGGANGFARPGHFPGATDPRRWRDEVVLAIAEHDNGWWETEAMPRPSEVDGLPVGVGEAAAPTQENEFSAWREGGFDRWRRGIERLAGPHPYAALLTSLHAYWLYAVAFDDLVGDDTRRHFVFGPPDVAESLVGDPAVTRAFLEEQRTRQAELRSRLENDRGMARATRPEHLDAHLRLLQLLDSMSLFLALRDSEAHVLEHVPRAGWSDRVTITWRRLDERRIALAPYPFDTEGLLVPLVVRVMADDSSAEDAALLTRLHGAPLHTVPFRMVSG